MTQDELIKNITWLAQEAGLQTAYPIDHPMSKFIMAIEARATDKEREACAKLEIELILSPAFFATMGEYDAHKDAVLAYRNLIRARGQA